MSPPSGYAPGCRILLACVYFTRVDVYLGTSYIVVDNSSGLPTIRNGYPRPLKADWPELSNVQRLDAALYVAAESDNTEHLYLFMVCANLLTILLMYIHTMLKCIKIQQQQQQQ